MLKKVMRYGLSVVVSMFFLLETSNHEAVAKNRFISIGTGPNDLVEGFKICTPIHSGIFRLD